MMRNDGEAIYYLVQHRHGSGWAETSLEHILFSGRTPEWKRSDEAIRLREILYHQSASCNLWQRYGIQGFVDLRHAGQAAAACHARQRGMRFRIIRRKVTQVTYVGWQPQEA